MSTSRTWSRSSTGSEGRHPSSAPLDEPASLSSPPGFEARRRCPGPAGIRDGPARRPGELSLSTHRRRSRYPPVPHGDAGPPQRDRRPMRKGPPPDGGCSPGRGTRGDPRHGHHQLLRRTQDGMLLVPGDGDGLPRCPGGDAPFPSIQPVRSSRDAASGMAGIMAPLHREAGPVPGATVARLQKHVPLRGDRGVDGGVTRACSGECLNELGLAARSRRDAPPRARGP